jgi:hypothetical protein
MITKQTTPTRRTHQNGGPARSWRKMAAGIGLAAGALLIVLALLAGRADAPATPISLSLPSDNIVRPAPSSRDVPIQRTWSAYDGGQYGGAPLARPVSPNVPIQHTWSAYDGQARPARATALSSAYGWPGATLMGSAYNGLTNHSPHLITPSLAQGWPGATLTGSAYSGQPHQALRRASTTASGWSGGTLMGSAYSGQTRRLPRPIAPSSAYGWPGATLMGSAYSGQ